MAEIFDENLINVDFVSGETYRAGIFDSLFGFGIVKIEDGYDKSS